MHMIVRKNKINIIIATTMLFFLVLLGFNLSRKSHNKPYTGGNIVIKSDSEVKPHAQGNTKTVISLNKVDKNRKIKSLIKLLGDADIEKSIKAADKLAVLGKTAVPELITALDFAPLFLKGQIVFLLGRIGDRVAVSVLQGLLRNDDNAYIRRNAAEALGKIKDQDALIDLVWGLSDDDFTVRERSAYALGELKNNQATVDLAQHLGPEKEERVKSAIVKAIGEIKDKNATETLIKELAVKNNLAYKDEIVFSLGEIADDEALIPLETFLHQLNEIKPENLELKLILAQSVKIAEGAIDKIKSAVVQ